jgi:peptidoglycan LD-endopeptidase LytH
MSFIDRMRLIGVALLIVAAVLVLSMIRVVEPSQRDSVASAPAQRQPTVAAETLAAPVPAGLLPMPVEGVERSALRRDWGDSRGEGTRTHQGLDIMAPQGAPVLAVAPGTIERIFFSEGGGGNTIYLRSRDRRWSFYYAHLQAYVPDLNEGQTIRAGDQIGYVGDTGNAGPGNYHLHFGVSRMMPEEGWWQGTPIDPYPLLAAEGGEG